MSLVVRNTTALEALADLRCVVLFRASAKPDPGCRRQPRRRESGAPWHCVGSSPEVTMQPAMLLDLGRAEDRADLRLAQHRLLVHSGEHTLEARPRSRRWPGRWPSSSGSPRPSRSASSVVLPCGRTLKPMMIASEAAARFTLFSVIAPTPRSMTRSETSSPTSILANEPPQRLDRAGDVALEDEVELWLSPFSMEAMKSSRVRRTRRRLASMAAALWPRACRRSGGPCGRPSTTRKFWPAPGTAVRPSTIAGRGDGRPRWCSRRARRASRARGREPGRATISVAHPQRAALDGPWRPGQARSRCASTTRPWASMSGLARRSSEASAVSTIASSRSSRPSPALAETSTNIVSPPYSSGIEAVLGQLAAPWSGPPGLVDLVDRHHDRHVGRLGGLSASMVCGITPSSARDHQDGDVGGLAPRARMAVNASWPGCRWRWSGGSLPSTSVATW